MNTLRIVGFILGLLSGLFVLIQCLLVPIHDATWTINLVVAILLLVGSLLGLLIPPIGGAILILTAGFMIIMGGISYFADNPIFIQYSFLYDTVFGWSPGGITVESLLALFSGEMLMKSAK
jgi:hypothetical protein